MNAFVPLSFFFLYIPLLLLSIKRVITNIVPDTVSFMHIKQSNYYSLNLLLSIKSNHQCSQSLFVNSFFGCACRHISCPSVSTWTATGSLLPITILIENVTKSRVRYSSFVHCWRPFHFALEYQVPLIMPPSLLCVNI